MTKQAISLIITALILVLVQAVAFNNICLFGVAVPIVFIYVIIKLPITLALNWVLTIGFLLGLIDDIFADTYGMNALACTLLAWIRKPVFNLYLPRGEEMPDPYPSLSSPGVDYFVKYLSTLTLIYCTIIFMIDAFTFFNVSLLVLRIVASTILSVAIMLAIDSFFFNRKHEKRG